MLRRKEGKRPDLHALYHDIPVRGVQSAWTSQIEPKLCRNGTGFTGRAAYMQCKLNLRADMANNDFPENIQSMIDDFSFLTDWEDRYTHVIDMGRQLPPLSDAERNPATKVNGCVSQVWLVSDKVGETLVFRGDSDAHIVKGLVAVALEIFSSRTPDEIAKLDAETILGQLDLSEHLSPQRSNGLKAMIARIKSEGVRMSAQG